jgi:CDP-diacylglycerol--glycerol-3-phosphate 3-phosphatidyltransferase
MTGGWLLSITALTDVLDGIVARRSNLSSDFGAFLDSSLDRVADGAVLGGLAVFYALNPVHHNVWMFVICLISIIGAYMTSYTRARAESLGLDAKVGMLQRPERVVLLSAPQALFGLTLNGWVLVVIVTILTITAWITVVQRVWYVYDKTRPPSSEADSETESEPTRHRLWTPRSTPRDTSARPALKGE